MKKRLIILIALLLIAIAIFISDRYGDKLLPIKLNAEKIESIKISSHSWDEFPDAIMLNGVDNADEITEIVRLYNESVQHHDHGVGTTHPNYVKITYNNGKEILFWCGVGDFITTAKGKRQYNYVNGELDEYIGEMISDWEEENFFVGDANLTIVNNDTSIQPYRNFLSCTTYYEGEWLCADGMGAYFLLMEKEDELPVVLYDGMMEFIISDDANVLGVSLFDANRGRTHHRIDEAEFFKLCENLDAGTYYVSVEVSYKGKYIEKEDKYESFADEYIFRMDVEENQQKEERDVLYLDDEDCIDDMEPNPGTYMKSSGVSKFLSMDLSDDKYLAVKIDIYFDFEPFTQRSEYRYEGKTLSEWKNDSLALQYDNYLIEFKKLFSETDEYIKSKEDGTVDAMYRRYLESVADESNDIADIIATYDKQMEAEENYNQERQAYYAEKARYIYISECGRLNDCGIYAQVIYNEETKGYCLKAEMNFEDIDSFPTGNYGYILSLYKSYDAIIG